ncbi:MAG TPA: glycosyltransferase family 39 protein [Lacunisphaera sp.]|nr:glycosyltransferase family 39 protein [Lacunisphaera sp.]
MNPVSATPASPPASRPVASALSRPEFRLALLGLAGIAAIYFGFIGLDVETAGMLVKLYGYYVMLLTFVLWIHALWRLWQHRGPGAAPDVRELLGAGAVIGLFSLMAVTAEPFRSKVLYDEFVLQSTAFNMHFFRDTATMVRGYDIAGTFLSLDNYLDKRPNFYPFLISLVHDLTGYRPANAYLLNATLYPVTLGLAYYLGRRLARPWGGYLAVLLLGSLPLLGQNATGSGMELLNFCMILVVAALAGAYLREPDETRLSALVLGTVLLAQSRYESAVYVAPAALVIFLGWWRRGRIVVSWTTVLAPLLFVPFALQNKVLNNTRWLWELKENQESRFSADYLPKNLAGARDFLFSTSQSYANSLTLTVLGLLALGWLGWHLVRRRPALRTAAGEPVALFLLGLGAIANTVLVMFYYWSSFNDPMASRFCLPLYLVLTFAVVAAGAACGRRWPVVPRALTGLALVAAVIAASHFALPLYSHTGIDEIEWERRFVAGRGPGTRLIITNKSTLPWLLLKTPSILVGRAGLVADRVQEQLEENTFTEILVMQSFRPSTPDGDHQLVPEDKLPKGFAIEPLAERRFGTKLTRISRLVSVTLPPAAPARAATVR